MNDVREATLIKTSAELDFIRALAVAKQRKVDSTFDLVTSILMLLFSIACFIVLIVWPISCAVKGVKSWVKPTMPAYETQDMAYTATPEIERKVLDVCNSTHNLVYDVDKDGKINCTDYAITFYEQYGSEARLIWWIVEDHKLTHMLCAVPNGYGQLIYIETQHSGKSLQYVLIQNSWKEKFDLKWCKDVTYAYTQLKNDTFNWRFP